MQAFRWLFHPVSLLIFIVLVVLYLNRETLFPEMGGSPEVKQLSSRVDGVVEKINADRSGAESRSANTALGVAGDSNATSDEAFAVMGALENGMEEPESESDEPSVKGVTETPLLSDATAGDNAAIGGSGIAVGESDDSTPMMIWERARRAAWQGNVHTAVENYRALIAMQPDNYDAYGELGNVLLHVGDIGAAVEAYSQAVLLLDDAGYPQAAWQLLDSVVRLDPRQGQRLYQTLRSRQLSRMPPG